MIEIPWGEWAVLLLIFAVAALAQGVLGFAFGIVAMTLLPFVMDFRDAVMLLAVLNAAVMLFALYWQRSSFRWGDARYLLIGALIGIPAGSYLVGTLSDRVLYLILGGSMLYISISHFVRRNQTARPVAHGQELLIGTASGLLAAGFNMGGPPLVAYIYSREWSLAQAKAVLASCFVVTGVSRLGFIGLSGVDLPAILKLAATLVVPTVVILWAGIKIGHRVPRQWLRPGVFVYLGIVGLYYLLFR
jgi:uncharacterized membrane protein YfcA